jgi:hypothetical protein
VRRSGRRVVLGDVSWLDGPWGDTDVIGPGWVSREVARLGGVIGSGQDAGLLPSLSVLAGSRFDPARLRPQVVDFYQHTAAWRMDAQARWSPLAWPFGWLVTGLFARRLDQLSLPLRRTDLADGMTSTVVSATTPAGTHLGSAWLRTSRTSGATIYSGWYSTVTLPGRDQPSVRVVFPLPNGNLTVFLRPSLAANGSLRLDSPPGRFGDDGAYLVVRDPGGDHAWVRKVPVTEQFRVYVDREGVLRTDHDLRFNRTPVVQLNYKITRR